MSRSGTTHPLGRYRWLSGDRLAVAKRTYRQDISIAFVIMIVALVVSLLEPDLYPETFVVAFALGVLLTIVRFIRGETFMQLRLREVRETKQDANKTLDDLHSYAASLSKEGKGDKTS